MMWHGIYIVWDYWRAAYLWDKDTNPEMMQIHLNMLISDEPIQLNGPGKMSNHLSENCLNDTRLYLMITYLTSFTGGRHLDGSIAFLDQTSKLVSMLNDDHPISGPRIIKLTECKDLFSQWTNDVTSSLLMLSETQEFVSLSPC